MVVETSHVAIGLGLITLPCSKRLDPIFCEGSGLKSTLLPDLAGVRKECRENKLETNQQIASGPRAFADRHALPLEAPFVPRAHDFRAGQPQYAPVQSGDLKWQNATTNVYGC